jgi:TPR repeat protein
MSTLPNKIVAQRWLFVGLLSAVAVLVAAYYYFCVRPNPTHTMGKEKLVDAAGSAVVTHTADKLFTSAQKANPPTQQSKKAFRLPPAKSLPAGNLKDNLAALADAAQGGDAGVAFSLADALLKCHMLDMRYAALQAQLAGHPDQNGTIKDALDSLDKEADSCRGLTPEQTQSYGKWLELAARQGDLNAQVNYPSMMSLQLQSEQNALNGDWITQYKNNSMEFLSAAANSGSVDALNQLATVYSDGLLVNKDPLLAYAYMYATVQTGLVPSASRVLNLWAQSLSSDQLSAAVDLGNKIYKGCCL